MSGPGGLQSEWRGGVKGAGEGAAGRAAEGAQVVIHLADA